MSLFRKIRDKYYDSAYDIGDWAFIVIAAFAVVMVFGAMMYVSFSPEHQAKREFEYKCDAYNGNIYKDDCIIDGKIAFTRQDME